MEVGVPVIVVAEAAERTLHGSAISVKERRAARPNERREWVNTASVRHCPTSRSIRDRSRHKDRNRVERVRKSGAPRQVGWCTMTPMAPTTRTIRARPLGRTTA